MIETLLDFHELLDLIKKGGDVTNQELDSASAYAQDNFQAIMGLLSALLSGYESLQAELARKNKVIEERNRRIHNLNQVLAETNRRYRAVKAALQEGEHNGQ